MLLCRLLGGCPALPRQRRPCRRALTPPPACPPARTGDGSSPRSLQLPRAAAGEGISEEELAKLMEENAKLREVGAVAHLLPLLRPALCRTAAGGVGVLCGGHGLHGGGGCLGARQ